MDVNTKNRSPLDTRAPLPDTAIKPRPFPPRREHRAGLRPLTEEAQLLSIRLLREASGAAGSFQRSVVGHVDHGDWLNRVRADGQRLIDLLYEMGFNPSVEAVAPTPGR